MMNFNVSAGKRFLFFICVTIICFLLGSLIIAVVLKGELTPARITIMTVIQDVMVFILPVIVTAMIITRRPAEFLQVGKSPGVINVLLVVMVFLVSVPAMNYVIDWNQNLSLPESLANLDAWLRVREAAATDMTNMMMGGTSVMSLVVGILTMGVLAGFSEEIFFRAGLQRLMTTSGVNIHVAVWVTAVLFSAVHFQFFGFVPRMLLGVFFGYLYVWSGSLWLPVAAHAINNTFACVSMWLSNAGYINFDINTIGVDPDVPSLPWLIMSASLTVGLIGIIYRRTHYNVRL